MAKAIALMNKLWGIGQRLCVNDWKTRLVLFKTLEIWEWREHEQIEILCKNHKINIKYLQMK